MLISACRKMFFSVLGKIARWLGTVTLRPPFVSRMCDPFLIGLREAQACESTYNFPPGKIGGSFTPTATLGRAQNEA